MKEPRNHLPQDLKALHYLDALNAGDLEAAAALWEEASGDPDLERLLAELDGAIFEENAAANGKPGAERVRGLMPKHLPGGSPWPQPPAARRRWSIWVGVVSALAAACLLAFLAWPRRDGKNPVPGPTTTEIVRQVPPQPPDDPARIAVWRDDQRLADEGGMPTFHWPLPETSPVRVLTSIPPDLLN
jgi:hypothetical protein